MHPFIKEYSPSDYAQVSQWWQAHGWQGVPEAILPKMGAIAFFEHEDGAAHDAAAGWLYLDNSVGVCWLEWLVTNPENTGPQSLRAINSLTEFFKERALELDYGVMLTTARQSSLIRVHERNGFAKTDEGVTHLINFLR